MPNPPGLGLPNEQRYDTTTIPGVVIDQVTGVFWQRNLEPSPGHSWPDADQYCKDLILAGYEDWRLPTRLELVSIVDFTALDPAVDATAFPNTPSFGSWSGSPHLDQPETAWLVYFKEGYTSLNQLAYLSQARCARTDIAPPSGYTGRHLVAGADRTVKDSDTGLRWKQSSEPDRYTFEAAQAQCDGLVYAGHDDWRVPSMTELQTLVDETVVPADTGDAATSGRIDLATFPDTAGEPYWTSSAYLGDPKLAWFVDIGAGYTFGYDRSSAYLVRCVR